MTEVALINGERKAIYYILGQVVIHEKKKKEIRPLPHNTHKT